MNEAYLRQRRNFISISIFIMLAILGGAKVNPLYPFHLERPFVAEMFMWVGFGYFWYRTKIYTPVSIFQLFKNEIIIDHVRRLKPKEHTIHNLDTFFGNITVKSKDKDGTIFNFHGVTDATGRVGPDDIHIPLSYDLILNKINYLKNIYSGKVLTNYYLPHIIGFIVLFLGVYKHRLFFICQT